jgi:transposase
VGIWKKYHPKNFMQILGLDISKASVSACLLLEKPTEPRQFYYDCHFHKFEATAFGIRGLLTLIGGDLVNTIAVMEPTGINYQRLWGTHLARAGVEVRLVGHKELRSFREHHLGLPDKDDDADALALAIYGWDYLEAPRRFVQVRSQTIVQIRRLVLRLSHLNRVQSPIINRARQDLAWQFPEAALV